MHDVDAVIITLELFPRTDNGEIIQRTVIHSEPFFTSSVFSFNFFKIVFDYFRHLKTPILMSSHTLHIMLESMLGHLSKRNVYVC